MKESRHLTPFLKTDVNDMLKVQVWDKDLIGADDLIGETLIPLSTLVGKKYTPRTKSTRRQKVIKMKTLDSVDDNFSSCRLIGETLIPLSTLVGKKYTPPH